jgi:dihydroorotate dehydrogenase electron transfer subunit
MQYSNTKVISQEKIASDIYVMTVGYEGDETVPGQFFMLKAWENQLPLMRPISYFKKETGKISFLYRVVGKGTLALSKLKKGAKIEILGPLGNGFPCDQVRGKIALVGGGIGIPPLYDTAKKLLQMNNQVDIFLGYKDELFAIEDFAETGGSIFVSCENGNEGYKGFVTELLHCEQYDAVFTCGPEIMMNKIAIMCKENNIPVWLSMERRMGCGIGACLVCTCETEKGMKRTCNEGPIFNGNDLLIN